MSTINNTAKTMSATEQAETFDALADGGDAPLGMMVWYSIPDLKITQGEVERLARDAGLSSFPKLCHRNDAFRRATAASQHRETSNPTRFLMRPIKNSGTELVRQIVVERVNKAGKTLAHLNAITITYDTDAAKIGFKTAEHFNDLNTFERDVVADLSNKVTEDFDRHANTLDNRTLTQFAMKCMSRLDMLALRPSGGLYFVPSYRTYAVNALVSFFRSLASYKVNADPLIFSAVPVGQSNRDELVGGALSSLNSEIEQLVGRIAETVAKASDPKAKQRASTVESRVDELADLRSKIARLRKTFGDAMTDVDVRVELLDAAASSLADAL